MKTKETKHKDAWSINVTYESRLHVSERNPKGENTRAVLVAASNVENAKKRVERFIHEMEDERGDRVGGQKVLSLEVGRHFKDGMVAAPDATHEINGKTFTIPQPGMDTHTADGKPWVLEGD